MAVVFCLECERRIHLAPEDRIGDIIECTHCESEFELLSLDQPEITWLYAEYDEWTEEEWEDDEPEEEWLWMVSKQKRLQNSFVDNHRPTLEH